MADNVRSARSTTTNKNNSMDLETRAKESIAIGVSNISVIKILNSLLYICNSLNNKINDAIYNNETTVELLINELQSAGCDVVELIRFLCCKGYIVKKLDKDRNEETAVEYKPDEYDTPEHVVKINSNDMYLVVDWTIYTTEDNPQQNIVYSSATYTLNLNV